MFFFNIFRYHLTTRNWHPPNGYQKSDDFMILRFDAHSGGQFLVAKQNRKSVKFNKTCENKENCVGPRRKPHIARENKNAKSATLFFPHDRDSFLVNNPKMASSASDIVWSFSGPPKGLLRIRVFIRNACSNLNSSFRGQGRRSLQSSKQAVH